jgi:hypothetical protein
MTRIVIAALSIALVFVAVPVEAQESVISCLPDAEGLHLHNWRRSYELSLDDYAWQELGDLEGDDIWLGYNGGGFDVPDDAYGMWRIETHEIPDVMVWVFYSPSTDEFYWFPFPTSEPSADGNGNHYGVHPCGAYRVSYDDVVTWIIGSLN